MHPVDLESHGILFCHFPGLESPGKKTTGMESPGNSLKSSYKILRIYKKKFSDGKENWFTKLMLGMKGYMVKLKPWKNQSES